MATEPFSAGGILRLIDERDALAESHAELVAALDWAMIFANAWQLPDDQLYRDTHAKALHKAQAALDRARAPVPE